VRNWRLGLRDPIIRYLLADEVGLGKTIEAGIVGRLARHVLGSRQERLASPPNLKWDESDLAFPPAVAIKAGLEAKQLASSLLTDLQLRQSAAAVLNEALGEALPGLVGLKEATCAKLCSRYASRSLCALECQRHRPWNG
jgi:hypothetical protein